MKQIQKVWAELSKGKKGTNLSSKKREVKLSVADDIEKGIKSADDQWRKLDDKLNYWYNNIFALNDEWSVIYDSYTEFDSTMKALKAMNDQYAKAAEEFGMDPKKLPLYEKANTALYQGNNMVAEYFTANATAKKIKQSL